MQCNNSTCETKREIPARYTSKGGQKERSIGPRLAGQANGMDWPRAGKGSLPRLENVSRQKDCEPIGGQSARHEFHQELASGVFHSGQGWKMWTGKRTASPLAASPHGMNFTKNWLQACSIVVQGDDKQTIEMPILPDGAKPPGSKAPNYHTGLLKERRQGCRMIRASAAGHPCAMCRKTL